MSDCLCGNNVAHTIACKRKKKNDIVNEQRKATRHQMRKEHRCIYFGCGVKVKPKIVYHQHCKKHKQRSKKK